MFAKLKKKIAEEATITPRPGGPARIPRTISKESITSAGADSGDDFASDGSSSRDDLSSQISRRNEQIRRLEAKLSDYAEQVRNLQKMKDKLEIALEKHQDSSMRKLQDQNEAYQANRAKMAEGFAVTLEQKEKEWTDKLADIERENRELSAQVKVMKEQSLSLFQKRDDLDELEGFQQQEVAKVKHMLLKKEELLSKTLQDLETQRAESAASRVELDSMRTSHTQLREELHKLQTENAQLVQQRTELTEAQNGAEQKITELESRQQELQDFIQSLSLDLQKAQSSASGCEKKLNQVQSEYESLKLQHQLLQSKVAMEAEEKDNLIKRLQEKILSLEKTLEGTGEEGVHELLKEKDALEMRLDDAQQKLLDAKVTHAALVKQLDDQATKLNREVEEARDLLTQKEEELAHFKEESSSQLIDLQQTLKTTGERLERLQETLESKEEQVTSLQSELASESSRLAQQLASVKQQCTEKVERLEAQVSALESARDFDRTAAQHKISQLEQENKDFEAKREELEAALKRQETEQERLKEELSSREMVSVEIAKALEECRKQKEDLQQEVMKLSAIINDHSLAMAQTKEELARRDQEAARLKEDYDAALLRIQHIEAELEDHKSRANQSKASAEQHASEATAQLQEHKEALLASESEVSSLRDEVSALHEQLHGAGAQEQNGEMKAGDIMQLQKEHREMAQQIAEKNKTIKQLQQRMAELKKTLQKELKIKPEPEVNEMREKPNSEMSAPASLTVTNNSDLNDSREINFEYLKHVVLKFMSARETEAFHLIKAVSVLLNFSVEEENLVKETLEYKMSWFGSKPSPKGAIRPSISKPRTTWS
ncbi:golgin subfamily A member 1 [Bombina bombina]|uniref:golgin subfamily A member 1 n=1 Tax=Bombina bombina TaxID=8345 RepID=UPI00235A78D8|nr:golgin subfamily A member 1 [Bombina bombina]